MFKDIFIKLFYSQLESPQRNIAKKCIISKMLIKTFPVGMEIQNIAIFGTIPKPYQQNQHIDNFKSVLFV